MEVTVAGSLTSGQQFYGTDTIKITTNYFKYLAGLASRLSRRPRNSLPQPYTPAKTLILPKFLKKVLELPV